MTEGQNPKKS